MLKNILLILPKHIQKRWYIFPNPKRDLLFNPKSRYSQIQYKRINYNIINMSNKEKPKFVSQPEGHSKMTDTDEDVDLDVDIDDTWTSAGKTRNYVIGDPLLDYLSLYGEKKGYIPDKSTSNNPCPNSKISLSFSEFIMKKGQEFEEFIMKEHLIPKFGDKIFDLKSMGSLFDKITNPCPNSNNKKSDKTQQDKYRFQLKETYKMMKEGTPIIYQGFIFNPENKTFGYPDLIVRSDYLNKICEQTVISEGKISKGCRFSNQWHYRIVDIKFTKLKVKADGKHLLKSSTIEAYKSQLYVYNRALGYMQNLVAGKSYLLGRGWQSSKTKSTNPFDKLACVDFYGEDIETKENTEAALEWLTDLKENGMSWKLSHKPTRDELYPNMSNDTDSPWHTAKKLIANDLKEITSIWQCGVQHREYAHGKKIYGWNDKKCTSSSLGLTGKVIPKVVDAILDINRGKHIHKYDKTSVCSLDWRPTDDAINIYFDFETVSDINNVRSLDSDESVVFMTGIGYMQNEEDVSVWNYRSFITDILSGKEEELKFKEFIDFTSKLIGDKPCKFYHFSSAEPVSFNKVVEKYNIKIPFKIIWIDLLKVMKDYMFVINGCFDFSLKSIVGTLSSHKLINVDYSDSDIVGGSQAMVAAFHANDEVKVNRELDFVPIGLAASLKEVAVMKLVEKYNEIDCKTLMELVSFLDKTIKK